MLVLFNEKCTMAIEMYSLIFISKDGSRHRSKLRFTILVLISLSNMVSFPLMAKILMHKAALDLIYSDKFGYENFTMNFNKLRE